MSPAVSRGGTKGPLLRRLYICLSVCLSVRLSVRPSVLPSVRPSVCLSCLSRFSRLTSFLCNNSSSTDRFYKSQSPEVRIRFARLVILVYKDSPHTRMSAKSHPVIISIYQKKMFSNYYVLYNPNYYVLDNPNLKNRSLTVHVHIDHVPLGCLDSMWSVQRGVVVSEVMNHFTTIDVVYI